MSWWEGMFKPVQTALDFTVGVWWSQSHDAAGQNRTDVAVHRFRKDHAGDRTFIATSKPEPMWKPIDKPRNSMSPREFNARNGPKHETSDGWTVEKDGFFNRRRD